MSLNLGSGSSGRKGARLKQVLLVEDNPADVRLMQEVVSDLKAPCELTVAYDGEQAMEAVRGIGAFAGSEQPDLILLDLNLPKKNGREVLSEIKRDEALHDIPVIVLTTSRADSDIASVYRLNANCFLNKPMDLDEYVNMVRLLSEFWLGLVQFPPRAQSNN